MGFKGQDSIAIECGRTKLSKILVLQKKFTKVTRRYYNNGISPKRERKINFQNLYPRRKIIALSKLSGKGRIQVPIEVRQSLNLKDGDDVFWVESEGKFHITKAVEIVL